MLTNEQFLLCKLAEEAAEVSQRAMKMQQYGGAEIQPGQALTNAERLRLEIMDLATVIDMMEKAGMIAPALESDDLIQHATAKRVKIAKYRTLAASLACVVPEAA